MSIVALQGDQLKKRGVDNYVDLALAVPNMAVQGVGAFQRRISIRGIGNIFGSASLVGVYVDEAPVTGNVQGQLDLRIHDLERIEVLRGPQGTLYGEGAAGGAIRFITNDPVLDAYELNTDLIASGTEEGGANFDLRAVANLPLIEDQLALRIAGTYVSDGGWIDQPGRGLENINDQEIGNVRAKLLWRPNEKFDAIASVILHRNDAGSSGFGEDDAGNYIHPFGDNNTPGIEDDYELYNLEVSYDLGSVEIVSSTTYLNSEKNYSNNAAIAPISPPPAEPLGVSFGGPIAVESFSQEIRFSSNGTESLNWTVGGFYKDFEDGFSITDYTFAAVDPISLESSSTPFVLPGTFSLSNLKSESWAVFGEVSYLFDDRLEVGAGIRYFEDEREFSRDFFGVSANEGSFDALSPRIFARYDISEAVSVYANAAEGFRSGGFNPGALPNYDPESILSYEFGVKGTTLDGTISSDITLFYSDYSDVQVVGLVPGIVGFITSNSGDAEIKGVEASFMWSPTTQLLLGVNGAWTDTEFVTVPLSASHAVGDPLDGVPEYSFGFWADYSFNWFTSRPGYFRLDYNQQGKSYFRNRDNGPHYLGVSDEINMLNAHFGIETENWSVGIFVENVTNERGFLDPFTVERSASRPRPRTFGIRLSTELN